MRATQEERSGGEGQTVQETRDQTGNHKGKCHRTKRAWLCHTRITSFSMGFFDVYQTPDVQQIKHTLTHNRTSRATSQTGAKRRAE